MNVYPIEFCNGTSWNLIRAAACSDATPNVFVFTDQSNQTTSTQITSDIVQVNGINCTIPVTVSGVQLYLRMEPAVYGWRPGQHQLLQEYNPLSPLCEEITFSFISLFIFTFLIFPAVRGRRVFFKKIYCFL